MLSFILGSATADRRKKIEQLILSERDNHQKVIYLVPDQYSFEAERELYFLLNNISDNDVQALSFSSLCRAIFAKNGGLATPKIKSVGQAGAMWAAFESVREQLMLFEKQRLSAPFVESLCRQYSECAAYGMTPDYLQKMAAEFEGDTLGKKLADLGLVFAAYQAIIGPECVDNTNLLNRAAEKMEDFFANTVVIVDGFTDFTSQQFAFLCQVLQRCNKLYVSLLCRDIYDESIGPYYVPAKTARRFLAYAKKNNIKIHPPVICQEDSSYAPGILAVQAAMEGCDTTAECHGVQVCSYTDREREIRGIAVQIQQLVHSGYRWQDIAVMVRDSDEYTPDVQRIFALYDIPVYLDDNQFLYTKPTFTLIQTLCTLAAQGFTSQLMLSLCNLVYASTKQAQAFERYVYMWSIEGKRFSTPFLQNPSGFAAEMSPEEQEQLNQIEAVRDSLVQAVLHLKAGCTNARGRDCVQALYGAMEELHAYQAVKNSREALIKIGKEELADLVSLQYNAAMDTLDEIYNALGDTPMNCTSFCEFVRLSLSFADYATPPTYLDQVVLGVAGRSRLQGVKVCFCAGMVYGKFPKDESTVALISDKDREKILKKVQDDVVFAPDALFDVCKEQTICLQALTAGSQRLYVSYYTASDTSETFSPSEPVLRIVKLPGVSILENAGEGIEAIQNQESAFAFLCANSKQEWNGSILAALPPEYRQRYQLAMGSNRQYQYHLTEKNSEKLYTKQIQLSPSGLDQFLDCPFAFFASRGLKLNPIKKQQVNALQTGTFIHFLLQHCVEKYRDKLGVVTNDVIEQEVQQATQLYFTDQLGEQNITERQRQTLWRISQNTVLLLRRMRDEFAQSRFVPVALELAIGDGEQYPPMVVKADDVSIRVRGIVDRVDTATINGETYVRVIDYKSGSKEMNLAELAQGHNMQMFLYLFTLQQDGMGKPAGVLYMPAYVEQLQISEENLSADAAAAQVKPSGMLLNNIDVLQAMEKDLAGKFVPVTQNKGGELSKYSLKSLATDKQFDALQKYLQHILAGVANNIHSGQIEAFPQQKSNGKVNCDFCDFKAVCGRELQDESRSALKVDSNFDLFTYINEKTEEQN